MTPGRCWSNATSPPRTVLGARAGRRAPAAGAPVRRRAACARPTSSTTRSRACCRRPTLQGRRATPRVLLADAIGAGRRICIVADYDCDGATACAVALRGLRLLGAAPGTLHYVVPDRARARLRPDAGRSSTSRAQHAPTLLVTVDNGIASHRRRGPRARARHRRCSSPTTTCRRCVDGEVVLPDADVIVNPNQPGCGFASKYLAGVGVMFYVLLALRAELRERGAFTPRRRSRASTRCSTWSRSARWPTWSGSTPTTAAWSRRA